MNRTRWICFCGVTALAVSAGWVLAQQAAPANAAEDPADQPTEYGIRFTPGMARALAKIYTDEALVKHYSMDKSKAEQANELVARRLMKMAHDHGEKGQDLAEFAMTKIMEMAASERRRNNSGVPLELGKGMGERMLPLMPAVREMIDGVVQDVRPMLGITQQLKMTGEIALVNVALDAFEKNMRKWSQGEVDPFGNPFESADREVKKDADGQSRALKDAQHTADTVATLDPTAGWDGYIASAKTYYQLDPAQQATADSLLRDYKERAEIALGGEEAWRARVRQNRLWGAFAFQMKGRWNNPFRSLLDQEYAKMKAPLEDLEDDLKRRVEEIPTQAQREAAEKRVRAALAAKGLDFGTDQPVPTAPAASREVPR